jgi:hypothetical protein
MEEKNVLFKQQTAEYSTKIYKPFCSLIVEKPKEVYDNDDDLFGSYPISVKQTNFQGKDGFF